MLCRFRIVNSLYSYVNSRRCVLIWIEDYADERWLIDPNAVRLEDKDVVIFGCVYIFLLK